jgi:hypothetical protein
LAFSHSTANTFVVLMMAWLWEKVLSMLLCKIKFSLGKFNVTDVRLKSSTSSFREQRLSNLRKAAVDILCDVPQAFFMTVLWSPVSDEGLKRDHAAFRRDKKY